MATKGSGSAAALLQGLFVATFRVDASFASPNNNGTWRQSADICLPNLHAANKQMHGSFRAKVRGVSRKLF
jgi:hypothetical protein